MYVCIRVCIHIYIYIYIHIYTYTHIDKAVVPLKHVVDGIGDTLDSLADVVPTPVLHSYTRAT